MYGKIFEINVFTGYITRATTNISWNGSLIYFISYSNMFESNFRCTLKYSHVKFICFGKEQMNMSKQTYLTDIVD